MKKKLIAAVTCGSMVLALGACSGDTGNTGNTGNKGSDQNKLKVGVILVGDENEGYTYAHIKGIKDAQEAIGSDKIDVQWKYSVGEDASCYDACMELADEGCKLIITNSYGHQSHAQQAAAENKDVTFVSMTGDTAAISGLPNFKNAFTEVYESRYVSGVVAGMKLEELVKDGKLTDKNYDGDNIRIGYVGAYPYAEVVSGYTAFYLGIKSVVENVTMEVKYTNSWFDITAEGEAANAMISDGCVIIGQHADSTGAPAAIQAALKDGTVCYSVGYNVDMLSVAPDAALTSATNDWSVYYKYAFQTMLDGKDIKTDWAEGYDQGAVAITSLGSSCAAGTQEKVDQVIKDLKDGKLHVFDINNFTVDGKKVESHHIDMTGDFDNEDPEDVEAIKDGYFHESYFRSAPSFDIRIDGITELTK